ncbi:MAG: hypothetical protein AB7H77_06850 [Bdellovibrionales bacterium]
MVESLLCLVVAAYVLQNFRQMGFGNVDALDDLGDLVYDHFFLNPHLLAGIIRVTYHQIDVFALFKVTGGLFAGYGTRDHPPQ